MYEFPSSRDTTPASQRVLGEHDEIIRSFPLHLGNENAMRVNNKLMIGGWVTTCGPESIRSAKHYSCTMRLLTKPLFSTDSCIERDPDGVTQRV